MIKNIETKDRYYDNCWMTKIKWDTEHGSNEINVPTKRSSDFIMRLMDLQNQQNTKKEIKYIRAKR